MLKRRHALTLALALRPFASLAQTEAGPEQRRLRAIVDDIVRPLMARYDIPGMAVGLAVDGRSHVFNHGVAAVPSAAPVTDATIFELGSISKMFTATLAAYAHATGKLSLQDHPSRFIPSLQGTPINRATLLHLGTYTAGDLPLQFPDAVGDDDQALAYLGAFKPTASPGAVRRYSNPSIGLLGAATAAAMREPFATLMASRLLPAFGMRHSHLRVPPEATNDYAWGHRDGKPVRVNPGPMDAPAYGLKSTAADMLRFVQANLDPRGLDPAWRRAIELTQVGHYRVGSMVQGLGWQQYADPVSRKTLLGGNSERVLFDANPVQRVTHAAPTAPRLFDKTGSTNGFGAYVAFVPARRIGVVLLANRSFPITARVEAAYAMLARLDASPRRTTRRASA